MKQLQQIFKWATLLFFSIAAYALTIGQIVPIEFSDPRDMHLFYDIILQGLPLMILLTLVWTLKKERPRKANIAIGIITPLLAGGVFVMTISLMFSYGFGAWINEEVLYENKNAPEVTINRQRWDMGALGYGGERTVKLKPFLTLWRWVEKVDTPTLDKSQWSLVQKEGDIKYP